MDQTQDQLDESFVERRREPRYRKYLSINLYDDQNDLIGENIKLLDLSVHGFCFETIAAQFNPGDTFLFFVDIPNRGPVSGKARICWSRSHNSDVMCLCGAEIQNMGWQNAGQLRQYLQPLTYSVVRFMMLTARGIAGIAAVILAVGLLRGDVGVLDRFLIEVEKMLGWFPAFACVLGALISALVYFDLDW